MRNIIIGVIICAIGSNHIFSNILLIEQDITNVSKTPKDELAQKNSFNNKNINIYIETEPYTDLNKNGKYDYEEEYIVYEEIYDDPIEIAFEYETPSLEDVLMQNFEHEQIVEVFYEEEPEFLEFETIEELDEWFEEETEEPASLISFSFKS